MIFSMFSDEIASTPSFFATSPKFWNIPTAMWVCEFSEPKHSLSYPHRSPIRFTVWNVISGITDNFAFAEVREGEIERLVREVVGEGCDAVAIFCTNMRGAFVAAELEPELRVPIYDSVAVTLWKCLIVAGVKPARVKECGQLFQSLNYNA
jgi:Asp/Glu/Hydantoin racemase